MLFFFLLSLFQIIWGRFIFPYHARIWYEFHDWPPLPDLNPTCIISLVVHPLQRTKERHLCCFFFTCFFYFIRFSYYDLHFNIINTLMNAVEAKKMNHNWKNMNRILPDNLALTTRRIFCHCQYNIKHNNIPSKTAVGGAACFWSR